MALGVALFCLHEWKAEEWNTPVRWDNGKEYRIEHCYKCSSVDWRRSDKGLLDQTYGSPLWDYYERMSSLNPHSIPLIFYK